MHAVAGINTQRVALSCSQAHKTLVKPGAIRRRLLKDGGVAGNGDQIDSIQGTSAPCEGHVGEGTHSAEL